MRFLRTKEQKDNLAKYCWDISKVAIAALGIAPLAKPDTVEWRAAAYGILIGVLFGLLGYVFDGKEVRS